MSRIELEKPVRDALVRELARYLKDEFGVEAGSMEALLMVDFITERFGPHFYNQAVQDARAVLEAKVEQIGEAIDGLERSARF